MKSKKSKKINVEQNEPLSMIVNYHHYKDITLLQVIYFYEDGSTTSDVARSTSCIYHIIERRAFLRDVVRKIQHVIHHCNFID